ncbi:hypothetical protein PHET_10354 [Paragonimus heterotremus]|uniref:Rho-GAP domain-containing protein n=1 Tax=Paragonimus heterotremus TaxID=100268 RepID=A0A8J4SIU8_9TREM|nr:hypothetical protein PHET_10354 [Paragonimus heterotremus]
MPVGRHLKCRLNTVLPRYHNEDYFQSPRLRDYYRLYPTSARLLDPLPPTPTLGTTRRTTINTEGKKSLQMILYVTSAVELHEPLSFDPSTVEWSLEDLLSKRYLEVERNRDSITPSEEFKLGGPRLLGDSASLTDFRPLKAPFVPELVLYLVNEIETRCHKTNWDKMFEPLRKYHCDARRLLKQLLKVDSDHKTIKDILDVSDNSVIIVTLRMFLNEFHNKPLHFSRSLLEELISRPLFDHFLRPNPELPGIIQKASLPTSRTHLDTLSFLMIHLLHALEYCPDPLFGKARLCNLYGPLLISFAERPRLHRPNFSGVHSEEAAILDAVLEVCNSHFWNHMTMLKIDKAFEHLTYSKRQSQLALELKRGRTESQMKTASIPSNDDLINNCLSDCECQLTHNTLCANLHYTETYIGQPNKRTVNTVCW